MNIFFLDSDPKLAAQYMCNKHVVKMILESAQLLCTCHHIVETTNLPEKFYRQTHFNHPCAIWVRQHANNYNWLAEHALHLCEEYSYRYEKVHASQNLVEWLLVNEPHIRSWFYKSEEVYPANTFEFGQYWLTEPPQCMPDEYKVVDNPVQAYRNYYFYNKRVTIDCKWTRRNKPDWFLELEAHDSSCKH